MKHIMKTILTAVRSVVLFALKSLFALAMLLVVVVCAALVWLAMPQGRDFVRGQAEHLASSPDFSLKMEALDRLSLGGVTLRGVQLADARGVWLDIDRLDVSVDYKTFLASGVFIEAVSAPHITLTRLPDRSEADKPPSGPPQLPSLELKVDVPRLGIGAVKIDRLSVGEAVYGEAENFMFDGSLNIVPRTLTRSEIRLTLESLDHEGEKAEAAFHPVDGGYRTALHIAGGVSRFLGAAAGLDAPLTVALDGQSEDGVWAGTLDLNAEKTVRTKATLEGAWREGDLTLTAQGDATLEKPETIQATYNLSAEWLKSGQIVLRTLSMQSKDGRIDARTNFDPAQGTIDARINAAIGTIGFDMPDCVKCSVSNIRFEGAVTGRADHPAAQFSGRADRFTHPDGTLGQIELTASAMPSSGTKEAYVIEGTAKANAALDATLTRLSGPVTASLAGKNLLLKTELKGDQGAFLAVNASLPFDTETFAPPDNGALAGTVRGAFDLKLLERLMDADGQRMSGRLAVDATLAGTIDAPGLNGAATLRNGSYDHLIYGTTLRDITADITLSPGAATVERLSLTDGTRGTAKGTGKADLSALDNPQWSLTLETSNFQALSTASMGGSVTADLTAAGDAKSGKISGTVRINQAEIYVDNIHGGSTPYKDYTIHETGRPDHPLPAQKKPVTADAVPFRTDLNLKVSAPHSLYVRGYGLDSEWGADLQLDGTSDAPLVHGTLFLVRGRLEVADLMVQLQKGDIAFNGAADNPELDITGLVRGRSADATLNISGTADKPSFSLTSPDGLPQDEVIARVLFGENTKQLTPGQTLQVARTLAALSGTSAGSGIAGFDPLGTARKALGLDDLSVSGGDDDTKSGPSVSAGKYISDNVYVSVDQGTTPGSSAVRAEIGLTDNIDVETQVSGTAESRAGVKWKWDY